jgi:transcriptional regulator with XRE-family HTH domain
VPKKLERKPQVPIELRLFIKHLKYAREEKCLTQREVADIAGLTQHYISHLETEQANVGIDSMGSISQALEIPLFRMLDPFLIKEFKTRPQEWALYKPLIDNSSAPFERKLLGSNFRRLRISQGYMLKEAVEQTQINKRFLIGVEKFENGISIQNAVKLSSFLTVPLAQLLIPLEIKQYITPLVYPI